MAKFIIFVIDDQTGSATSAEMANIARQLAFEGSKACNRKVELRPLLG